MTAMVKAELDSGRALGAYEKSLAALVVALGLPASAPGVQGPVLAPDYVDAEQTLRQDGKLAGAGARPTSGLGGRACAIGIGGKD